MRSCQILATLIMVDCRSVLNRWPRAREIGLQTAVRAALYGRLCVCVRARGEMFARVGGRRWPTPSLDFHDFWPTSLKRLVASDRRQQLLRVVGLIGAHAELINALWKWPEIAKRAVRPAVQHCNKARAPTSDTCWQFWGKTA